MDSSSFHPKSEERIDSVESVPDQDSFIINNPLRTQQLTSAKRFQANLGTSHSIIVLECSNAYAVILFILSSLITWLYLYAAFRFKSNENQKDAMNEFEKLDQFWNWTVLPMSTGALLISFFLKVGEGKRR